MFYIKLPRYDFSPTSKFSSAYLYEYLTISVSLSYSPV